MSSVPDVYIFVAKVPQLWINSFKRDKNENDGTVAVAVKKWTPWLPNDYEVSEKPAFLVS